MEKPITVSGFSMYPGPFDNAPLQIRPDDRCYHVPGRAQSISFV